jgi:hypothetical protein
MWLWQKWDTCVPFRSQLVTGQQNAKVFDTVFHFLSLPLQRSTHSTPTQYFSTKSLSALHLLHLFAIYTSFSTLDVYLLHKSFHKHTRYSNHLQGKSKSICYISLFISTLVTATISKGSRSSCSGLGFWLCIVVHFSKVFFLSSYTGAFPRFARLLAECDKFWG